MPELIESPVRVEAYGEPPKTIDEFAGRSSNGEARLSVARMRSPDGADYVAVYLPALHRDQ